MDPELLESTEAMYRAAKESLADRFTRVWPGFTKEAFCWAAGMVQSRTFHLRATRGIAVETHDEEEVYLLPGIDMVNHVSHPEQVSAELETFSSGVDSCRPDSDSWGFRLVAGAWL